MVEVELSSVVFACPDQLLHNTGLLELIINRFGSVSINSNLHGGSPNGICFCNECEEFFALLITDYCIDLADTVPRMLLRIGVSSLIA